MVTKSKKQDVGEQGGEKGKVKVGTLKLNRETVKDLTASEQKQIKAGYGRGGQSFRLAGQRMLAIS